MITSKDAPFCSVMLIQWKCYSGRAGCGSLAIKWRSKASLPTDVLCFYFLLIKAFRLLRLLCSLRPSQACRSLCCDTANTASGRPAGAPRTPELSDKVVKACPSPQRRTKSTRGICFQAISARKTFRNFTQQFIFSSRVVHLSSVTLNTHCQGLAG